DPRLDAIVLHDESYSLVAAPSLLRRAPLAEPQDARNHSLVDIAPGLPLFRYFVEARGAPRLAFARRISMGTIAAIRAVVLNGDGVAVLPNYYIAHDLARKRLKMVLPRTKLRADAFRLVFRGDDPRRATYAATAGDSPESTLASALTPASGSSAPERSGPYGTPTPVGPSKPTPDWQK